MLVIEAKKMVNKTNLVIYSAILVVFFVTLWNTIEISRLSSELHAEKYEVTTEILGQSLQESQPQQQQLRMPAVSYHKECSTIESRNSGVYQIKPDGADNPFSIYCDFEDPNEKWMVIQRRVDGSVNFIRDIEEYQRGFGDLRGEFWLGLDNIYQLTKTRDYELMVKLTGFDDYVRIIRYDDFYITSAADGYRLQVDGYHGKAGDALTEVVGFRFSTYNAGNMEADFMRMEDERYCKLANQGGWWFDNCARINPNGVYGKGGFIKGIMWHNYDSMWLIYKDINMMIRKKSV